MSAVHSLPSATQYYLCTTGPSKLFARHDTCASTSPWRDRPISNAILCTWDFQNSLPAKSLVNSQSAHAQSELSQGYFFKPNLQAAVQCNLNIPSQVASGCNHTSFEIQGVRVFKQFLKPCQLIHTTRSAQSELSQGYFLENYKLLFSAI